MKMRAMWSGAISFGLVNIPVKIFKATDSSSLDLDLLRKSDLCPVRYARICKGDNEEIPYKEIVKGYEYSDGNYVVLTDEDFESANAEKTKTIDITGFINEEEIDIRYFEKPYYLQPEKNGTKAYQLLLAALATSGKVGIAEYVLRNRGSLGIIKPVGDILVLNKMRFFEEIRRPDEIQIPKGGKIKEGELNLALKLIQELTEPFEPEKYQDTYIHNLKKVIEDKAQGIKPQPVQSKPQQDNVIDIMELLKQSLNQKRDQHEAG